MRRSLILLALAAGTLPTSAFAQKAPQYAYTKFDVPNAPSYTRAFDINHAGTIVGMFQDAAGINHGYFCSGYLFTQVDVPGSTFTGFWAINDAGVGVGRTDDAAGTQHGFVWDSA